MEQEGSSGIQALDTPVLMYQGKGNEHLQCFVLLLLSLLKVTCALLLYLVSGSEVIIPRKTPHSPLHTRLWKGLCSALVSRQHQRHFSCACWASQQIFLCSHQPLAAGEYVKLPDLPENGGAFWPVLEFSVPICNLRKFSTLAVVEHH